MFLLSHWAGGTCDTPPGLPLHLYVYCTQAMPTTGRRHTNRSSRVMLVRDLVDVIPVLLSVGDTIHGFSEAAMHANEVTTSIEQLITGSQELTVIMIEN